MGTQSDPAPVREETAEEMVARIGGTMPAALDAVRTAAGFPGRWKAIVVNLEKLWVCLPILSSHLGQLETHDNALCRELLQSVPDTLATATDIAGRCRAPLTAGKLQLRNSIDALAVKVEVNLRDCELLVKIGELYDDSSSSRPLDDITSTCSVRELQRLLALLQMSHTEAKYLALDGILEALHKDDKCLASMLDDANASAMVELLTASWPMVVREKAATVVCHMAGSYCCKDVLVSQGALMALIKLAESGSVVGRQKAAVALHHLASRSYEAEAVVMWQGGLLPLIEMCRRKNGDSVTQSAAAGTLKNISAAPDLRQVLANHGIIRVMVGLLGRGDAVPESKEHAVQCLVNLTAGYNGDELRRAILSEGGLRGLLLYLGGDNDDQHQAAVSAIRNLVRVISTSSEGDTTMKRLAGEQGCVSLLVRTMLEHNSKSARQVAAQALASLATYPPNAKEMNKDDKCVAGLVQLLDPSHYSTATIYYAIQCLLSLASTKRSRKLMISHGANGHLKKLMDVHGATELLQRLEGGMLRSLFSSSKQ
ncbi:hypothetical protein QOZ80_9BG0714500 [Eleusine coracana subsp. coracana]|nr:hypothetical protein QOZ80_9BG0714500 [Eleusine coracana subsp. coracana]